MKKIIIILFLSSCVYVFSQSKQDAYNKQLQAINTYSYIFKTENTIKASEAKYIIEISRKKLNLNRAFFNSENQLFIYESYNTINITDINEFIDSKIIKFDRINSSIYIRELFSIKKDDKPKKLPKFYVK